MHRIALFVFHFGQSRLQQQLKCSLFLWKQQTKQLTSMFINLGFVLIFRFILYVFHMFTQCLKLYLGLTKSILCDMHDANDRPK